MGSYLRSLYQRSQTYCREDTGSAVGEGADHWGRGSGYVSEFGGHVEVEYGAVGGD